MKGAQRTLTQTKCSCRTVLQQLGLHANVITVSFLFPRSLSRTKHTTQLANVHYSCYWHGQRCGYQQNGAGEASAMGQAMMYRSAHKGHVTGKSIVHSFSSADGGVPTFRFPSLSPVVEVYSRVRQQHFFGVRDPKHSQINLLGREQRLCLAKHTG